MPTNKNAQLRYRALDRCFSDRTRRHSFDDLLEAVNKALRDDDPKTGGVETRQLRKDLNHFRSAAGFDAPLETLRDGNFYFYTYSDKDFSISKQPLKENEAEQLKDALEMLSRFQGAPQFQWLGETIAMLSERFDLSENSRKVMSFESNIDYSGYKFISPIFNAIVKERVLVVEYKPFSEDLFKFKFHPYYLKQYNNRWFVFGFNTNPPKDKEHLADIWNMPLDRILSLKEVKDTYKRNEMDWEEDFFSEIVGVSRKEGNTEKVILQFTKEQAPYIQTKPLHPFQKNPEVLEDGSIKVRLDVVPNYELEQLILSFGEKVRVISPESLAEKINDRLVEAALKY